MFDFFDLIVVVLFCCMLYGFLAIMALGGGIAKKMAFPNAIKYMSDYPVVLRSKFERKTICSGIIQDSPRGYYRSCLCYFSQEELYVEIDDIFPAWGCPPIIFPVFSDSIKEISDTSFPFMFFCGGICYVIIHIKNSRLTILI